MRYLIYVTVAVLFLCGQDFASSLALLSELESECLLCARDLALVSGIEGVVPVNVSFNRPLRVVDLVDGLVEVFIDLV